MVASTRACHTRRGRTISPVIALRDQRASAAILDITGVKTVNTTVADVLVRAARSARLLGAEVVLTGVGPGLAQALVEAGADLGEVVVRGTVQGGIAYALGLVA